MKRSRSHSNIPLARPSMRASSLVRHLRTPSMDRAQSLSTTPLNHRNRVSSTPSSAGKISAKMLNNKKWVHDQYLKVQDFIEQNQHIFDLAKVNPNNIKPPTISTFVHLMSGLINQLQPNIKITEENYKEAIPLHLKLLKYPGTISQNTFRIVNTMSAFPNIIAIQSWLIDSIRDISLGPKPEVQTLCSEQNRDHILSEATFKYQYLKFEIYLKHPERWNMEEDDINQVFGLDPEDYNRAIQKLNSLNTHLDQLQHNRQKKYNKNRALKEAVLKCEEEIDVLLHEREMSSKTVNEQYKKVSDENEKLRDYVSQQKSKVNFLIESISKQPCTYLERDKMLNEIDKLVHSKSPEHLMNIQELNSKYDFELNQKEKQITEFISKFNTTLMKARTERPELQTLMFPENNILNALNKIQEVIKAGNHMHEVNMTKNENLKKSIEKQTKDMVELQEKVSQQILENNDLLEKLTEMRKNFELSSTDKKELLIKVKGDIEKEKEKLCQLQNAKLKKDRENKELLESLQERRAKVKEEFKTASEDGIKDFITLNKEVVDTVKQLDVLQFAQLRHMVGKQSKYGL